MEHIRARRWEPILPIEPIEPIDATDSQQLQRDEHPPQPHGKIGLAAKIRRPLLIVALMLLAGIAAALAIGLTGPSIEIPKANKAPATSQSQ